MLGGFADGVVEPCGPLLRADLDEAVLYAFDAPFFIERQNFVELPFERLAVDIKYDSNAAMFRVVDNPVQIQRAFRAFGIDRDGPGVGFFAVFCAVPAGVKFDVLQIVLDGEIDAGFAAGGGQSHFADNFARPDP